MNPCDLLVSRNQMKVGPIGLLHRRGRQPRPTGGADHTGIFLDTKTSKFWKTLAIWGLSSGGLGDDCTIANSGCASQILGETEREQ